MAILQRKTGGTVLVLGFYDRFNLGDEAYKQAIPLAFDRARANFTFACMDDVITVPAEVDIVIVGGGDVINSYFMERFQKLLSKSNYSGRVYAYSVGVPYEDDAKYACMFDHMFVRSTADRDVIVRHIGSKNVTVMMDATFALPVPKSVVPSGTDARLHIGLCLAQPAFHGNTNESYMLKSVVDAIETMKTSSRSTVHVHLLSFNTSQDPGESDIELNTKLFQMLTQQGLPATNHRTVDDPAKMIKLIGGMRVMVCMRYHSLVFSLMCKRPTIALFCTPKMQRIVADLNASAFVGVYKLETNVDGQPTGIDSRALAEALRRGICDASPTINISTDMATSAKLARSIIFQDRKPSSVLVKPYHPGTLSRTLDRCKTAIMAYMTLDDVEYDALLTRTGPVEGDHETISSILCYCITGTLHSKFHWGLANNMKGRMFCMRQAMEYIWGEVTRIADQQPPVETYYPTIPTITSKTLVTLDDFAHNGEFEGYHRAGWQYAMGGMMNIDSRRKGRDESIFVDTYVDRTFHWGKDTLRATGYIPYTKPWIGFVHHTLDETHSRFNCHTLFETPEFIESLRWCRCLLVLTEYMRDRMMGHLVTLGYGAVPVEAIPHPMHEPPEIAKFTMKSFTLNPTRRVVQIGAWLRNPYGIYELQLGGNALRLTKAALRGKNMGHCFRRKLCDIGRARGTRVHGRTVQARQTSEQQVCGRLDRPHRGERQQRGSDRAAVRR